MFKEYSAGLTSRPFWYIESKKTARMMLEGLDKEAIRKIILEENVYQAPSKGRANHMFNSIYRRLNILDMFLIEKITTADVLTSKVLVMLAIMGTDRLFFEFMYEVFREKLLLGDYSLKDRDMNVFFDYKRTQSNTMSKWTDYTINKMKSSYTRILFEVGLMEVSSRDRKITPVNLDYRICQYMRDRDIAYLYAVVGGN